MRRRVWRELACIGMPKTGALLSCKIWIFVILRKINLYAFENIVCQKNANQK